MRPKGRNLPSASLAKFTNAVLSELGAPADAVGLALLSDAEVQDLNRRFRGLDRPTDVLSFPAGASAPGRERYLGDVVIGLGVAARQARTRRHSLQIELERLLLHGLLHLAGFDHETDSGEMMELERSLWCRLGKGER